MNMKVEGSPLSKFFDKLKIELRKRQTLGKKVEKRESLLEIIKRRYAKGEITKTQFEEIKRGFDSVIPAKAGIQSARFSITCGLIILL